MGTIPLKLLERNAQEHLENMEPQELKTPCCILCLEILANPSLLSSEKKNNEWMTQLSLKALQCAEHATSFWFSFSGDTGREMEEELGNLALGNGSWTLIPLLFFLLLGEQLVASGVPGYKQNSLHHPGIVGGGEFCPWGCGLSVLVLEDRVFL